MWHSMNNQTTPRPNQWRPNSKYNHPRDIVAISFELLHTKFDQLDLSSGCCCRHRPYPKCKLRLHKTRLSIYNLILRDANAHTRTSWCEISNEAQLNGYMCLLMCQCVRLHLAGLTFVVSFCGRRCFVWILCEIVPNCVCDMNAQCTRTAHIHIIYEWIRWMCLCLHYLM